MIKNDNNGSNANTNIIMTIMSKITETYKYITHANNDDNGNNDRNTFLKHK